MKPPLNTTTALRRAVAGGFIAGSTMALFGAALGAFGGLLFVVIGLWRFGGEVVWRDTFYMKDSLVVFLPFILQGALSAAFIGAVAAIPLGAAYGVKMNDAPGFLPGMRRVTAAMAHGALFMLLALTPLHIMAEASSNAMIALATASYGLPLSPALAELWWSGNLVSLWMTLWLATIAGMCGGLAAATYERDGRQGNWAHIIVRLFGSATGASVLRKFGINAPTATVNSGSSRRREAIPREFVPPTGFFTVLTLLATLVALTEVDGTITWQLFRTPVFCALLGWLCAFVRRPLQPAVAPPADPRDRPSLALNILCFVLPPLGLASWLALDRTRPRRARSAGRSAARSTLLLYGTYQFVFLFFSVNIALTDIASARLTPNDPPRVAARIAAKRQARYQKLKRPLPPARDNFTTDQPFTFAELLVMQRKRPIFGWTNTD